MKTTIKFILTSFLTLFIFSGYAQEQIPLIEKGAKNTVLSNKKGTKKLNIEILDVIYSDSTRRTCKAQIKFQLTATGGKIPLFKKDWLADSKYWRLSFAYFDVHRTRSFLSLPNIPFFTNPSPILLENQTESFTLDLEVFDNKIFVVKFDDSYLMVLNKYEGGEIIKQREEEIKRKEEEKRLAEQLALKRQQEERDSIEAAYAERRKLLLTPPYLANWVGASFFTKENIEKDCDVRPVAYHGGSVMYSFPLCGVTMEFEDTHHVCVELSFRLFGKMGYDMKKDLIEYGYKLQSQSKDLIAENNFSDLTEGRRSVYKCKLDHGGYSTCIILEGQAMMFTFYRTKD